MTKSSDPNPVKTTPIDPFFKSPLMEPLRLLSPMILEVMSRHPGPWLEEPRSMKQAPLNPKPRSMIH